MVFFALWPHKMPIFSFWTKETDCFFQPFTRLSRPPFDQAYCNKTHSLAVYEPPDDKTNKMTFAPSKPGHLPSLIRVFGQTQIILGICPVWSESSLSAWRNNRSSATHWAHCEDSDQTGHLPSLIRAFTGHMKEHWVLSYPLSTLPRLCQTGWMLRLIWVFAGRTDHFAGSVMRRLYLHLG